MSVLTDREDRRTLFGIGALAAALQNCEGCRDVRSVSDVGVCSGLAALERLKAQIESTATPDPL